jgi:hypothetical protein
MAIYVLKASLKFKSKILGLTELGEENLTLQPAAPGRAPIPFCPGQVISCC